ncbi:putative inactive methylesterase 20 isoform X2 [Amborella trichopoda]|uniref:putative inactive methylesterase 20 isoform X2 n=1 Tax=Amborella trichopoda TaxID=13333 RepID=UPI0005D3311A|nr:putative inactive methylesterase 20 isoform X2 [Amborella trichopoda]|eukprot:XP_011622678.1 putative inactive methylesterase 20 isoform X2 [Amborella trichopoda]
MVETPATKHFVLIHGACHGAWCWYKMASLLKSAGYKVSAVDLGGAGINMGNADSISTFEEYNRPAIDIISGIPENEKVILVGHSIGGFSLTHAIYKFGKKKISLVVYVAAAPANFRGDSTLASMVMRWAPVSAFADASLDKEIERVTTLYVKTDKDQMMSQERHEEFIHFLSPEEVLEVEADHSPFFSATVELFSFLDKAAAKYCSDELPKK